MNGDTNIANGKQRSSFDTNFAIVVLLIIATVVAYCVQGFQTQKLDVALDKAAKTELELKKMQLRLKQQRSMIKADRERTFESLAHYKTADDIPDLGERLVSVVDRPDCIVLYVPDGEYELDIVCDWEKPSAIAGRQKWKVPISGSAGYAFQINAESKEQPPSWVLSSNDKAFAERKVLLSEKPFFKNGADWNSPKHFCSPNSIDAQGIHLGCSGFRQSQNKKDESKFRITVRLHVK